jgi:DnaJ-class molecular chaperone
VKTDGLIDCGFCLGVGAIYVEPDGRRVCPRCLGTKIEPPECRACRGTGQFVQRLRRFSFFGFEFGDLVPRVVNCTACGGFGYPYPKSPI